MSVFKFLLLPFAVLYDLITTVRNRLYDRNYKPSVSFDIPVISVGNLAVGGTGKTPMVEHLIRLLSANHKIATLSRGYGRKTKGFKIATDADTAATIGDEPYQVYKKYSPVAHVVVGEDRALAIPSLLQELDGTDTVILDDALQHRRVKPGFSILLTEFNNPFYSDYLMPYGRLRESPEGAKRADVIVVTKCPAHIDDEVVMEFEHNIRQYSDKPVFFSTVRYTDPVAFGSAQTCSSKVILLSGIANAHILEAYVRKTFNLVKHFAFRDHYFYTRSDVQKLSAFLKEQQGEVSILTTEKDYVKLERSGLKPMVAPLPIFYLPIEAEFIRNGKDFDALVLSFMQSFKRD